MLLPLNLAWRLLATAIRKIKPGNYFSICGSRAGSSNLDGLLLAELSGCTSGGGPYTLQLRVSVRLRNFWSRCHVSLFQQLFGRPTHDY